MEARGAARVDARRCLQCDCKVTRAMNMHAYADYFRAWMRAQMCAYISSADSMRAATPAADCILTDVEMTSVPAVARSEILPIPA
jgi:hypothetical protein